MLRGRSHSGMLKSWHQPSSAEYRAGMIDVLALRPAKPPHKISSSSSSAASTGSDANGAGAVPAPSISASPSSSE